ncbi:MAG: hypothetical protein AAB853_00310 [Patescibacteria group bacterium]
MSDAKLPVIAPEDIPTGYTVDELYDFFDFFDATIDDVYAYVLHCSRAPDAAAAMTLDVYLSLLQRRRFFFWKQSAKLATVLALADRLIASGGRWREDTESGAYALELSQCLPAGQTENMESLRVLQRVLRALSFREQRMAILSCFLGFPPSRTAQLLGADKAMIEREYDEVQKKLDRALQSNFLFRGRDARQFLGTMRAPSLSTEKKRAMRQMILERSRAGRGSSIRFALPVAMVLFITASTLSLVLIPPVSITGTRQRIAAAEVLLLSEEDDLERNLKDVERSVQTISASYVEKELADIAVNVAPYAVRKQVTQNVTIARLLQYWENSSSLLSRIHHTLLGMDSSPTLLP